MRRLLIPTAVSGLILLLAVCLMLVYRPGFSRPDGLTSSNGSGRKPGTSESLPASDEPSDRKRDEAADGDAAADGTGVACLHGKVKDEAGRGLGGASVILKPMTDDLSTDGWDRIALLRARMLGRGPVEGTGSVATALTAFDGSYSIPIASIPRGTYQVLARHADYVPQWETWSWVPGSTELNFQLGLGDTITGRVL